MLPWGVARDHAIGASEYLKMLRWGVVRDHAIGASEYLSNSLMLIPLFSLMISSLANNSAV